MHDFNPVTRMRKRIVNVIILLGVLFAWNAVKDQGSMHMAKSTAAVAQLQASIGR